ncbi:MAG: deoxyribodipyrimidine photolyase [Cellvibrionaceae bacterium]|jgi:deoxyribodipyrimidine photolyase
MVDDAGESDPLSFNIGLYWFTNDLRVEDNHALLNALKNPAISFVYTQSTRLGLY